MRRLRILAPVATFAVIAIAVLLVTGAQHRTTREFSLRTANQEAVALLKPSERVCEGPVTSPHAITGVKLWGGSVIGLSRITVQVQHAGTRQLLASGPINATGARDYVAALDRPVAGGTPLRICVVGALNTFSLEGSASHDATIVMTGPQRGLEFSLALVNDHHSLLGALPLVFGRASLFKLSWIGSWTFWVLAGALLACFGVAVVAVGAAAADDDRDA